MNSFVRTIAVGLTLSVCAVAVAQNKGYDVFVPISKYMSRGDAERLSAWFAENLDITILSTNTSSSRNQARQIMKSFFASYSPRSFEIDHKADRANMKYALGTLNAGGEVFVVTIFVSCRNDDNRIQQLKIEKIE